MGCTTGRSRQAEQSNTRLHHIRYRIERCYDALFFDGRTVTPQKARELYLGKEHPRDGIVRFFRSHNGEFGRMVGATGRKHTL